MANLLTPSFRATWIHTRPTWQHTARFITQTHMVTWHPTGFVYTSLSFNHTGGGCMYGQSQTRMFLQIHKKYISLRLLEYRNWTNSVFGFGHHKPLMAQNSARSIWPGRAERVSHLQCWNYHIAFQPLGDTTSLITALSQWVALFANGINEIS